LMCHCEPSPWPSPNGRGEIRKFGDTPRDAGKQRCARRAATSCSLASRTLDPLFGEGVVLCPGPRLRTPWGAAYSLLLTPASAKVAISS